MKKTDQDIPKISKEEELKNLHKRISFLEEELRRKQKELEKLKEENELLFKTAVKRTDDSIRDGSLKK